MRDNLRVEVAQISEAVVRTAFTHSNVMAEVSHEIQVRLPETIRQHAQVLLPELARASVTAATPDPAQMRAWLLDVLDADARDLVSRTAENLLPGLAANSVREVTPDPAVIRTELVESATRELTELLRGQTDTALTTVITQGTEQVHGAVTEAVEREIRQLIPRLAEAAVTEATPDTDQIRAELVRGASAGVLDQVRAAVAETAPHAVAEAIEGIRESLTTATTETVATAARELLPDLARRAVDRVAPDIEELRELLTDDVRGSAAKAIEQGTEKAVPEVVKAAIIGTVAQIRQEIEEAQRSACAAVQLTAGEAVDKKLAEFTPNIVEVVLPTGKRVEVGSDTHEVLPELLVALNARCHVLLVGPAGTGKSMLAKHAADALDIEFQALSLGPTTPMSKVFGYYDAHGNYHDTPFRRAFEHGGVMLLDELDNGHPGLLAELNQALALGTCAFADGMVHAHPDFRLVATGNTYGTGGDRQYVGRQTLDSATLDRFVVIDVPIDEGLEERIALRHAPSHEDELHGLLTMIRGLRNTASEKNLPVMFSPRTSIDGARLLEAGATVEQVMRWRVVRGLSAAHRKTLGLD